MGLLAGQTDKTGQMACAYLADVSQRAILEKSAFKSVTRFECTREEHVMSVRTAISVCSRVLT
ncbi:hypothetical protein D3C77_228440 [compost metagenome]